MDAMEFRNSRAIAWLTKRPGEGFGVHAAVPADKPASNFTPRWRSIANDILSRKIIPRVMREAKSAENDG
jgi:hypothetical protein